MRVYVILSCFKQIQLNSTLSLSYAVFVAKLLISGVLPSISVILVLQSVFLTRPLVSGILFFNSDLSVSYLFFKANLLVSIAFTLVTNLSYYHNF